MITNLAEGMASVFVSYGESSEENADIYAYACEAIIFTLVNVFICLLVALVFGRVVEGLVFITSFALLRRYTGGHHAKTHLRCILTFNTILIFSLLILALFSSLQVVNAITLIAATVALVGIFLLAEAKRKNNKTSKRKGRYAAAVLWAFCIVDIYILNVHVGPVIALSMLSVLGSLAYAILHKRIF